MLTGPTNLTPAPEDASEGDVAAHEIADCRLREPQAGLWLSIIHWDLRSASSPFPELLQHTPFNAALAVGWSRLPGYIGSSI